MWNLKISERMVQKTKLNFYVRKTNRVEALVNMHRSGYSGTMVKLKMCLPVCVWEAFVDSRPIGWVAIFANKNTLGTHNGNYEAHFFVKHDFRRRGVGTCLYKVAKKHFKFTAAEYSNPKFFESVKWIN